MSDKKIHINCDMGESYGRYQLVDDEALMPYISACNIACGFHAGDPVVIDKTIKLAIAHGIEIGAHPSYPDLQGFGRRTMDIAEDELEKIVRYQVSAMLGMVHTNKGQLIHVKPHGALYNKAVIDRPTARAIVKAIQKVSSDLTLYAPFQSLLNEEAQSANMTVLHEAFIDRQYNDNLTLASRSIDGSVITDATRAKEQVVLMHEHGFVHTMQKNKVAVQANTYCIHGDNPSALDILQHIKDDAAS